MVAASGRSLLVAALLAMDASLHLEPGTIEVALGEFLAFRSTFLPRCLITGVNAAANLAVSAMLRDAQLKEGHDQVVAAAKWRTGRVRAVGGRPPASPVLAFDGPSSKGLAEAAADRYIQNASSENRMEESRAISSLAMACLETLDDQERVID